MRRNFALALLLAMPHSRADSSIMFPPLDVLVAHHRGVIVVGHVVCVRGIEGLKVADVEVDETLQGPAPPRMTFFAEKSDSCDTTDAVQEEHVLLFLQIPRSEDPVEKNALRIADAVQAENPSVPYAILSWWGRGRMPIRNVDGRALVRLTVPWPRAVPAQQVLIDEGWGQSWPYVDLDEMLKLLHPIVGDNAGDNAGAVSLFVDGKPAGDPVKFDDKAPEAIRLPDGSSLLTPGEQCPGDPHGGRFRDAVRPSRRLPPRHARLLPQCPVALEVSLSQTPPRTKRLVWDHLVEGEIAQATATLTSRSKEPLPMTVAIIGLPGGLEPRHDQLKELVRSRVVSAYEVRGREVVLYCRSLQLHPGLSLDMQDQPAGLRACLRRGHRSLLTTSDPRRSPTPPSSVGTPRPCAASSAGGVLSEPQVCAIIENDDLGLLDVMARDDGNGIPSPSAASSPVLHESSRRC